MAQYKSYTHVLRIDKDEVQGILCGNVVVMPKLDGTNACLFMKDGTVHAGSRTREINMNKDNANFCKTLTLNGEKEFPQIIQYLESHPDHIVYGEWLGADDDYAHFWYVNADWSDTCLLQSRLNSYLETEKRSR